MDQMAIGTPQPAAGPTANVADHGPGRHQGERPAAAPFGRAASQRGEDGAHAVKGRRPSKADLLAQAAKQFCALERPRREDIEVFREFFYQMIDGCGQTEKRALAARLAPNPYVPRAIILYLALDEADVAAPLLLLSPVLGEADIIELTRRLGPAHIEIMCRRDDLTSPAIVALLARGGKGAAAILSRNARRKEARPAETAEAKPQAAVKAAPTAAPPQERRTAGPREELLELASKGGRLGRGTVQAAQKGATEAGESLARRLIMAARARDRDEVAALIAEAAGCRPATITSLLERDSLEPISVVMKGLAIDNLAASQLILLLRPEIGRSREEAARAVRLYRRLNAAECRRFVATLGGGRREDPATATSPGTPAMLVSAITERRREIATRVPARPDARPIASQGTGAAFGKSNRSV